MPRELTEAEQADYENFKDDLKDDEEADTSQESYIRCLEDLPEADRPQ